MAVEMRKWIALNDASGAKLKLATIDVQGESILHVFITNLSYTNPKWNMCLDRLNFRAAASKKFLVRRVAPGERFVASQFHSIFPKATLVSMPVDSYLIKNSDTQRKEKTAEEHSTNVDMQGVKKLGRNFDGAEVFDSPSGRFYLNKGGARVAETPNADPHLYMRLVREGAALPDSDEVWHGWLAKMATGFVISMDDGEVQRSEDFDAFHDAIFGENSVHTAPKNSISLLSSAIDSATIQYVRTKHELAQDAYGMMARLYDYQPAYRGGKRGVGAIPAPLNVIAQRLLGDTTDKEILYPNAHDGAAFAFLPDASKILAYKSDLHEAESTLPLRNFAVAHPGVLWGGDYIPKAKASADALFYNADPVEDASGTRQDYLQALQAMRELKPQSRAIFVLAADSETGSGTVAKDSLNFLNALSAKYSIDDVFETAPILSQKCGGTRGLRVFSVRNAPPVNDVAKQEQAARIQQYRNDGIIVLSSWDHVKSHVDEVINRLALKEAESIGVDLERERATESYQRPYIAFSKIGEARTMIPANLQASAQSYMTRLENLYGPTDAFIQEQLGMGMQTLSKNFSPEQVDGVACMISRYLVGRSSLLADDTGIGKGRQLAAASTWANKRGHNVIFITDRANLFSDLARDLKDIGEWGRFTPLVLNADGEITHEEFPGAEPTVLAKGASPSEMTAILERNLSLEELQRNMVFLTYSQISTENSAKGLWIKNQLDNALVIFDEAHIAAGSDSNIAVQVSEIAAQAKHVQFASATWAKTHDNMHIYQRAFPSSVSVSTLSETMRRGGDSFSEIFSTMLSAEGALIRREHDLSKLEVEMVVDENSRARNEDVSDRIADVLGSAAFISGEMQQVFIRANAESVNKLRGAREVRGSAIKSKLFSAQFGSGSVIYQVMKAAQGALNATHVADLAIESVEKGMKPVIVSDATGESLVEAMIEEMMANGLAERPETMKPPTLRDMLRHVIYKRLATVRVEEVTRDDVLEDDAERDAERNQLATNAEQAQAIETPAEGGVEAGGDAEVQMGQPAVATVTEAGVDAHVAFGAENAGAAGEADEDEDEPEVVKKTKRARVFKNVLVSDLIDMPEQAKVVYAAGLKEIEEKIDAVPDIPVIGFDVIAQRLRDSGITVGEISGRKHSMIRVDEDTWRLTARAKSKKAVKATIRSFNNGATDAVIINRSAAAGVSMHSSPRFIDQRRRQLIEHQIPEDPVNRIQLLGRVNRYDQLSAPLITTASTGIYGEVRYLMMQNRKLARMSANVRSSRDNAMSLKGVVDLFNSVGRDAVQGYLQDNPLVAKRLGITDYQIEFDPDIVNKLTMRIPLLRIVQQKQVYEDLYSRTDEILLRAELDGENPLRPNEMDIHAKTANEIVFFGDQEGTDEFTSAFDAPVLARKLVWEEERNPLGYVPVREAAKVNLERLLASGYLVQDGENAQPKVNQQLLDKVIGGFYGLVRLAHTAGTASADASTGSNDLTSAVLSQPSVKRAYLKHAWIKNNLPHLIPGAEVAKVFSEVEAETLGDMSSSLTSTIITDVRPPQNENELLDLGKWKITVISSGNERPQTYTLRSVVTAMSGIIIKGAVTGDLVPICYGSSFRPCLFDGRRHDTVRSYFDMAVRGKRQQSLTVLTGNMYLAAEWAAATKKGKSAIYSDQDGNRHRVIALDKDTGQVAPEHLPIRVADPDMIKALLLPMTVPMTREEQEANIDDFFVLDTTFKSAMAAISSSTLSAIKRESVLVVVPGDDRPGVIALSCSAKDLRRIQSALSSGQKTMRYEAIGRGSKASEDPAHVVVRTHRTRKDIAKLPPSVLHALRGVDLGAIGSDSNIFSVAPSATKKGKGAVLSLAFSNSEQAQRAIELVRKHAGLEVYATRSTDKLRAHTAISSVLSERRNTFKEMQRSGAHRYSANNGVDSVANVDVIQNQTPQTHEVMA